MASSVEVLRAVHEAFNNRDWQAMRGLVDPELVWVDHPRGLTVKGFDEFLGWCQEWVSGMSDARVDEPRYIGAETRAITQFQGRGVNDGELGPAHATGKAMDLAFCTVVNVEGDRMTTGEIYYDALTMMAQLGVIEASGASLGETTPATRRGA